jgi:ADP-ribosylglycohydrolase
MDQVQARFIKSFTGGIIGDVYGSVFEFKEANEIPNYESIAEIKKNHTHNVFLHEFGYFTDDTILMLCAMESFLENNTFIRSHQILSMGKYIDEGKWTRDGKCFDIGFATSDAYRRETARPDSYVAYLIPPNTGGNGILMKMAPYAYYSLNRVLEEQKDAYYKSIVAMSHGSIAYESAIAMGRMLEDIYSGKEADVSNYTISDTSKDALGFCNGSWNLALHYYNLIKDNICSPEEGMMRIIKHGGDTDTNACILGQLIGGQMNTELYDYAYKPEVDKLVEQFVAHF